MTIHITARMAWHDSGWNGHICKHPKANVYCVGRHSFPNEVITEDRNLAWEQRNAGLGIKSADYLPPCMWSVNAFGREPLKAFNKPPTWFNDTTTIKYWDLPPATIAIWPYEEVYKDEVKSSQGKRTWDAAKRRDAVNAYFNQITAGKSLIIYYANYSNPFSEGDVQNYVVVGISTIQSVGPEILWDDQSERMAEAYGPNVWARNITSTYPEEGMRIPYHRYMGNEEILQRLLFVPEDTRLFKYATRHLTDDDVLGLIEKFIEIVDVLIEIKDDSEDWKARQAWLTKVMADLWKSRGLYPGLPRVMEHLKFSEAVAYAKKRFDSNTFQEQTIKNDLFAILKGEKDGLPDFVLSSPTLNKIRQNWQGLGSDVRALLETVLLRFDLKTDQIRFLIDEPAKVNVFASPAEMGANPYVLSEQYLGQDGDDQINFGRIDRGVFPLPDLGPSLEFDIDSWQRLRALTVHTLQNALQHTFLPLQQVVDRINEHLSHLPERLQCTFKTRDFEIHKEDLAGALHFQQSAGSIYVYLKHHYEDERLIEKTLRDLVARTPVKQKNPVSTAFWKNALKEVNSALTELAEDYESILAQQAEVCQQIFPRALTVISGAAGTGKTTIVNAIITAIENAHGPTTAFKLLAPTGKAADRLRERTGKDAQTIHSFLTNGWLNTHNMTFMRSGKTETRYTTYIIDESSMLDLPLLAAFFRAVNWNTVQRIIFVGDPNQLPPIGTGRTFADLVEWLNEEFPQHVGQLRINVRQIVNRIKKQGTGIVDVASQYTGSARNTVKQAREEALHEQLAEKLWHGHDVDGDLQIEYWDSPEELETLLMSLLVKDMESITGSAFNSAKPYELWNAAMKNDPHSLQVLSPYRGELFGIEHLNQVIQAHKNTFSIKRFGQMGGITSFDKVIQVRNQDREAWNGHKTVKEKIHNGEIGFATISQKGGRYLNVSFKRRENLSFGYKSDGEIVDNLELAYAISVHKSQGSEFERVYFIVPKSKRSLLSRELFYTGLTRATRKCTLLIEGDLSTLLSLQRPESSHLSYINSSLLTFAPVPESYLELQQKRMKTDYEDGVIPDESLVDKLCQYGSEAQIARFLLQKDIPFKYRTPIMDDETGVFLLPTFTLYLRGEQYYWEHIGVIEDNDSDTKDFWEKKMSQYRTLGIDQQLVLTKEQELSPTSLETAWQTFLDTL